MITHPLASSHPLRALTVAVAASIAAGALSSAPASAATAAYANPGTAWLKGQLTKSSLIEGHYIDTWTDPTKPADVDYADYGTSLDAYFAMRATGTLPITAAKILKAVEAKAADYATAAPQAGKLAVAVRLGGGNPAAVGGTNLISIIEAGTTAGKSTSYGVVSQSWATRALVDAKSPEAAASVSYLLAQQCANGGFRQDNSTGDSCSDAAKAEVDSTTFALQTLLDARKQGTTGLDSDISKAVSWLLAQQQGNGSFVDNDAQNANSTGEAAMALAAVGQNTAAARAAAWLVKHQLTAATAKGKLAKQAGAIGYSDEAITAAKTDGIGTYTTLGQWTMATAQAAPATVPAKKLSMSCTAKLKRGGTQKVTVGGLSAGEPVSIYVKGKLVASGTASAKGSYSHSFKVGVLGAGRISAYGAFVNRSALRSYTVVK